MPNTPDIQTLPAVNFGASWSDNRQISEREAFYSSGGLLTGVEGGWYSFNHLGPHPVTGIAPVFAAQEVLGPYALVNLAGAGGHVAICADGKVYVRTAAGAESVVTMTANGAEPALATVMGVDTDVNGLQVGDIIAGSAYTNEWRVDVARVDDDNLTITLKLTTPATDLQWNGNVDVTGVVGASMRMWVGAIRAYGTPHTGVASPVIGGFCISGTITADSTAPVVSGFTIPGTDTDYVITISTFTVTEAGGTVYRAITMADVAPAVDSALWGAAGATPATYTIPVAEQTGTGTYTLYGWAKDGAGNISASVSDTIDLTIA